MVVGFTQNRPGGGSVHPGSLRSLGFALYVVWLIRCRWVRTGARWVHPESLGSLERVGSLGFALGFIGFNPGRCVHSGFAWASLGSSRVAGFTRVRSRGRWVHPGLLGSLGFALVVVGFIRVFVFSRIPPGGRLVHPGCLGSLGLALGVVGFIRGRWVHSGSPWWSLDSSGVAGFTRVRNGVIRDCSGCR